MSESDVESYWQVSTAHSSENASLSDYSLPPSETAVDVIDSLASTLSLITCATSVSEYSFPPSEADVSMSQLDFDREDVLQTALLNSSDEEEDGLNLVYSTYSLPPAETNVEMENCDMLYPQRFFNHLLAPEREECDTPAPPQMFGAVVQY